QLVPLWSLQDRRQGRSPVGRWEKPQTPRSRDAHSQAPITQSEHQRARALGGPQNAKGYCRPLANGFFGIGQPSRKRDGEGAQAEPRDRLAGGATNLSAVILERDRQDRLRLGRWGSAPERAHRLLANGTVLIRRGTRD